MGHHNLFSSMLKKLSTATCTLALCATSSVLQAEELDVEKDELPTASFDAVTCFSLFPHLDKKKKTLRNMHRLLKSKGILVIAHALSNDEIKIHHKSVAPPVMNDTLPSKEEMRQLLTRTGFTQIHITDEPGCYFCLATKQ